MNEKEIQLLERLIGALGENATATVDAYVVWYVAAAAWWASVGLALVVSSRWIWNIKVSDDWDVRPPRVAACVAVAVGLLLIGANIADLVAPRAVAIHQLLQDIVP